MLTRFTVQLMLLLLSLCSLQLFPFLQFKPPVDHILKLPIVFLANMSFSFVSWYINGLCLIPIPILIITINVIILPNKIAFSQPAITPSHSSSSISSSSIQYYCSLRYHGLLMHSSLAQSRFPISLLFTHTHSLSLSRAFINYRCIPSPIAHHSIIWSSIFAQFHLIGVYSGDVLNHPRVTLVVLPCFHTEQ